MLDAALAVSASLEDRSLRSAAPTIARGIQWLRSPPDGRLPSMADARQLVDKLWNYCNLLRDDGVSTIDYTEQLTYLLF